DRRLFECYLAEERGQPIDPPVAEHLADCEDCDERYDRLAQFMKTLRVEADAETDAIFTSEHLVAQRQQIARRIGAYGRSPRVISFPGVHGATPTARLRRPSRGVLHWIYAAAAAGVVLGIGLGTAYQWDWAGLQDRRQALLTTRATRGAAPRQGGSRLRATPGLLSQSGRSGSEPGRGFLLRGPSPGFAPADAISASASSEASDDAFLSDLEVALE